MVSAGDRMVAVGETGALDLGQSQSVTSVSGQNLSSYYCPIPEERVYISLAGDVYNPATLSVGTGAFVIWSSYGNPLPTGTHSITANVTANGPLPAFNATLQPLDQWGYTFTVPGDYHYYDIFYPSNRGEVIVHSRTSIGSAVLGVDMSPNTPNVLVNQIRINGSSFDVNVVVINATNLSSWEICLQYDASVLRETALSLAPEWDSSSNPNALGGASIYTGDGVIRADSYIINGAGINATGLETLFSVSFNPIGYGTGSLQLTGYLIDSNGYYIQYARQNGYYTIIPIAGLIYEATYTGQPFPNTTITVENTFSNFGVSMDKVTAAEIISDFGTFPQSTGLPLNIPSFANATRTMPLTIPSHTSPGKHQVTLVADWQYLKHNLATGTYAWVDAPRLTFSGSIIIESTPNTPPTHSSPKTGPLTIVQLLATMIINNWKLFMIGAVGVWVALVMTSLGLLYHNRRSRTTRTPSL
jgi:plastocyanin